MGRSAEDAPRERQPIPVQLIVGIPGGWATRRDLVTSVAARRDGLVMVGDILRDGTTGLMLDVDVQDPDPNVVRAFATARGRTLNDADLEAIAGHRLMVYLIGNAGSPDAARTIMRMAAGVLEAGGLGLKVESSGALQSRERWLRLSADGSDRALYEAFVVAISAAERVYSCGLHVLGLSDVEVVETPANDAIRVLQTFAMYTVLESPSLASGETFSLEQDSPTFRLTHAADRIFPPDDLFHNPFGRWTLTPERG